MTYHEPLEFVVGISEDLDSRESNRPEMPGPKFWVDIGTVYQDIRIFQ